MALSFACLDLVGEGHDAVVSFDVDLSRLLAEVVVPRPPHRLVDVAVGGGVEDLGQRHPGSTVTAKTKQEEKTTVNEDAS